MPLDRTNPWDPELSLDYYYQWLPTCGDYSSTTGSCLSVIATLGTDKINEGSSGEPEIGRIIVELTDRRIRAQKIAQIKWIFTSRLNKRRGVATRLYEIANQLVGAKGFRLASDSIRFGSAEKFWRKQEAHNTADYLDEEDIYLLRGDQIAHRNPLSDSRRGFLHQQAAKAWPEASSDTLKTMMDWLGAADPTKSGEYAPWLLRLLKKKTIRLPEDIGKLQEALLDFHRIKKYLPADKRDINRLPGYPELRQLLQQHPDLTSKKEAVRRSVAAGQELLVHRGDLSLIKVTTPEASHELAQDSGWCVKDPEIAKGYLAEGPLYFVYIDIYGYTCASCGWVVEPAPDAIARLDAVLRDRGVDDAAVRRRIAEEEPRISPKPKNELFSPDFRDQLGFDYCMNCKDPVTAQVMGSQPYVLAHAPHPDYPFSLPKTDTQVMDREDAPVGKAIEKEILPLIRQYAPHILCQEHGPGEGWLPIRDCECGTEQNCKLCLRDCDDGDCQTVTCKDCQGRCSSCSEHRAYCPEHLTQCSQCKGKTCRDHTIDNYKRFQGSICCTQCAQTCPVCNKKYCPGDDENCNDCNEITCKDCAKSCQDCHNLVCPDCMISCKGCQKQICYGCSNEKRCEACQEPLPLQRNPATGECFTWALREQAALSKRGKDSLLVHGQVTDPQTGHRYWHAWLEYAGRAYDWQSRNAKPLAIKTFVAKYRPTNVKKYDRYQAIKEMLGRHHMGPWQGPLGAPKAGKNFPLRRNPSGQLFRFGKYTWDIDKAYKLIESRKKFIEPEPFNVAQVYKSLFKTLFAPYVDEEYALAKSDLSDPVLFGQIKVEGEWFRVLIDGNHRVYRAFHDGVETLDAYTLTLKENRDASVAPHKLPLK